MINLDEVREQLRMKVYDPEIGVNVVDLGLVYRIEEPEEGHLYVAITMTTPGCPAHDSISQDVEWTAGDVPGVNSVRVEVVWDPPWSPEKMSAKAKDLLGFN